MSSINIIHGDCMEYMATLPDKAYELAIVDKQLIDCYINGNNSKI